MSNVAVEHAKVPLWRRKVPLWQAKVALYENHVHGCEAEGYLWLFVKHSFILRKALFFRVKAIYFVSQSRLLKR